MRAILILLLVVQGLKSPSTCWQEQMLFIESGKREDACALKGAVLLSNSSLFRNTSVRQRFEAVLGSRR